MNAYSKFMDISMHALPEPLTSADQASFPWLKFAHVEYLLDPEINSLPLEAQGALIRLMCYAARQYPFASLPNDMPHLVKAAGFKLPDPLAKGYAKAYMLAEHVVESVLEAAFILCSDDRYYCPLLTNELLVEPKVFADTPTSQNTPLSAPTDIPASSDKNTITSISNKKRSSSAERMARKRDRERLLKQQQDGNSNSDASHNKTDASHVTPENVTCDGSDTQCDAVTDSVTTKASHVTGSSVTIEGGKGGDLDLNQDLDSASKKNKIILFETGQKQESDYFQTPELGWTPRLKLLNDRLQMAGHKPVTQQVLLQTLVTFNAHFDDAPVMSDNKRLGKLVHWVGNAQRQQLTPQQTTSAPSPYRKPFSKPAEPASDEPGDHEIFSGQITYGQIRAAIQDGESYLQCFQRINSPLSSKAVEAFEQLKKIKPGICVNEVMALAHQNKASMLQTINFLIRRQELELDA